MKLSKAQSEVFESIVAAKLEAKDSFWWQVKREQDGTVYFPKKSTGHNVKGTMNCLFKKGLIDYDDHPNYGAFAWKVKVLAA